MNLWRIGWGMALNPSRESRWRQICVVLAVAVFTVMVLGSVSVLSLQHEEERRGAGQVGVLSADPAPSDLLVLTSSDQWRGDVIHVVTAKVGTDSPVPPGMQAWPSAGETVVSPALREMMSTNPSLAERYPHHEVLSGEGVRSGGQLLAYRVVGQGVLEDDDTVLRVESGQWVGSGPVVRIAGFGGPDPSLPTIGLTPPAEGSSAEMTTGLIVGLVLPGLVVLAVGLSAGSGMRTRRFDVLHALGASRFTQRCIGTVETLLLAFPGVLLGAMGWAVVSPRLHTVPVVGRRVVGGDLALPWWVLVAGAAGVLFVVAVVAASSTALRSVRMTSPRPAEGRPILSRLAMIPACAALGAFAAGKVVGGAREADLVLVGTAAAVVATPLMLPALVRSAGALLSSTRSPIRALAGQGMRWDPARSGRPFVGLGAALVLMFSAIGYLGLAQFTETPAGLQQGEHVVVVEWRGGRPDALSAQSDRLDALVVPVARRTHRSGSGSGVVLVSSCQQVVAILGGRCSPDRRDRLPRQTEEQLVRMLEPLGINEAPLTSVRLASASDAAWPQAQGRGQALVLADRPLADLEEQVRNVAFSTLPSANVSSMLQSVQPPSALVSWIRGGLVLALAALALACLLSLVDRLRAAQRGYRQLMALGATPPDVRALRRWCFGAPYLVVCLASAVAGLVICSLIVRPILPMPWTAAGLVAVFLVVLGAIGVLLTGLPGTGTGPESRD